MKFDSSEQYRIEDYKRLKGEDAVAARLSGMLPIIDICGHPFFVEVKLDLIRPMDFITRNGINLSKGTFGSQDQEHRLFYYDKDKMEDVDPELMTPGSKIALVRIPSPVAMDPVMTAILQEDSINEYIKQWPMLMYRVAETMSIPRELIRVLAEKPDLRAQPEKLFEMSKAKLRALTAIKRKKGKRL